jgi:hypothetical protein
LAETTPTLQTIAKAKKALLNPRGSAVSIENRKFLIEFKKLVN